MFDKLKDVIDASGVSGPETSLESNVNIFVNASLIIASGVSFAMLAVSMIQLVISEGDPKNSEKARTAVLWSACGLALSVILYSLRTFLLTWIGLDKTKFY